MPSKNLEDFQNFKMKICRIIRFSYPFLTSGRLTQFLMRGVRWPGTMPLVFLAIPRDHQASRNLPNTTDTALCASKTAPTHTYRPTPARWPARYPLSHAVTPKISHFWIWNESTRHFITDDPQQYLLCHATYAHTRPLAHKPSRKGFHYYWIRLFWNSKFDQK